MNDSSSSGLLRDAHWRGLDGALLRLSSFTPMLGATVRSGEVTTTNRSAPYASVKIECSRLSAGTDVIGFITHKLDFLHLWQAFAEDRVTLGHQEVLAYWTKRHYSSFVTRLLAFAMPRLMIMTCAKGTFEACDNGLDWPAREQAMVLVIGLESHKWWKSDLMA